MNEFDKLVQSINERMADAPDWLVSWFNGSTIWDLVVNNGLQAIGVGAIGWLIATYMERRHNAQMSAREKLLSGVRVSTTKKTRQTAHEGTMVIGSVVIAHDFFRTLIVQFRKLIGGNIKPYERLVTRGRREAFIRLREEAAVRGLDRVINVRFDSAHISGRFISAVELVAYGTGIKSGDADQ